MNRVRTLRRWGLLTLFLVTGLVNLVRGLLVVRFAPALEAYTLSLPPALLPGFYLVWAVVMFIEVGVCFLRSRCYACAVALIYQVTIWVVKLIGEQSNPLRRLWPRDLIFSLFFVALTWFLSSRRPDRQST